MLFLSVDRGSSSEEDHELSVAGVLPYSDYMYSVSSERDSACGGFGDAWDDITPRLDAGVLKERSSEAARFNRASVALPTSSSALEPPWTFPLRDGCRCGVAFTTRFAESGAVCASSRDVVDGRHVGGTDDAVHVVLGGGYRVHVHRGGADGVGEAAAERSGPPPRQQLVPGVELALRTMAVGDQARFRVRAEYMHGDRGDGFKVPGRAETAAGNHEPLILIVELELLWALSPLPKLPQGRELERRQKARKETEVALYQRGMSPVGTRLLNGSACRLAGNALLEVGCVLEAKKLYDSGFVAIFVTKAEWEAKPPNVGEVGDRGKRGLNDDDDDDDDDDGGGGDRGGSNEEEEECSCGYLTESEKESLRQARRLLYLNRALVNLKLGDTNAAIWDAEQSILIATQARKLAEANASSDSDGNGNNYNLFCAKALFRKGRALLAAAQNQVAKEDAGKYWDASKAQQTARRAGESFEAAEEHLQLTSRQQNGEGREIRAIAQARMELRRTAALIAKHAAAHEAAWGAVCRDKIMAGLSITTNKQTNMTASAGAESGAAARNGKEQKVEDKDGEADAEVLPDLESSSDEEGKNDADASAHMHSKRHSEDGRMGGHGGDERGWGFFRWLLWG